MHILLPTEILEGHSWKAVAPSGRPKDRLAAWHYWDAGAPRGGTKPILFSMSPLRFRSDTKCSILHSILQCFLTHTICGCADVLISKFLTPAPLFFSIICIDFANWNQKMLSFAALERCAPHQIRHRASGTDGVFEVNVCGSLNHGLF